MKTVAVLFLLVFLTPAWGHDCCDHHDCWGSDHRDARRYQRQQQWEDQGPALPYQSLDGKVAEVIYLPGTGPSTAMVEIRMQSGAQTTLIRLAPTGFLKQNELVLKEGDAVSIKGYRVAGMEGDVFVAAEVRKGNRTLLLRNDRGRPLW